MASRYGRSWPAIPGPAKPFVPSFRQGIEKRTLDSFIEFGIFIFYWSGSTDHSARGVSIVGFGRTLRVFCRANRDMVLSSSRKRAPFVE